MVRCDRRLHPAGAAMHIVLAVVAVLMMLASAMVALSTMNLNLMTSFHNGQIAQNEAEAGVSRLLYAVADKDTFGANGTDEIRGCVTPGYTDPETFHYVTFRKDTGFPYAVNNQDGTKPSGYLGRSVPSRMLHAFVTGHCRGQYRTIEVLLERPPFPFAVASSGRIRSNGPLVAQGTTSTGKYQDGDLSRPGNVASNSASQDSQDPAVYIGSDSSHPDFQTLITGFVQSSGMVKILQPAVVRGGIRPATDAVKLPEIDVRLLSNAGQPGVVEISPDTFGAQTLDVMYHCSHDLTYTGGLTLDNSFLYVKGNLVVQGGIKGSGAIVVTGNVTVQGDTSLAAGNRVALVAGGDAALEGQGNFFQGLVYCKGNISASRITVLGNLVVNSGDPTKGNSVLDQVHMVDNPDYASMSFTVTSSSRASSQQKGGSCPFRITTTGIKGANDPTPPTPSPGSSPGPDPAGGWYSGNDMQFFMDNLAKDEATIKSNLLSMKFDDGNMQYRRNDLPDAGGVFNALDEMQASAETYRANQARLDAYAAWKATIPQPSPAAGQITTDEEAASVAAANAALLAAYPNQVKKMGQAYMDYYNTHADKDGRYKQPGKTIDVSRTFDFDLNRFLPQSQRLKMKYWHVFHERL